MFTHSMKLAATVFLLSSVNMVTALAESCHVSTGAIAFGAYDTASAANLDAVGTLDIHCSSKVHVVLFLSKGSGVGASFSGGRKMTRVGGTGTLTYNLYADAARTRVLGDGTGGSVTLRGDGKNNTTQTIWGRLASGQHVAETGSYADSVVASIYY
jgi:spore coat protein U-like protein